MLKVEPQRSDHPRLLSDSLFSQVACILLGEMQKSKRKKENLCRRKVGAANILQIS